MCVALTKRSLGKCKDEILTEHQELVVIEKPLAFAAQGAAVERGERWRREISGGRRIGNFLDRSPAPFA